MASDDGDVRAGAMSSGRHRCRRRKLTERRRGRGAAARSYGENGLALHNIRSGSGTVTVRGDRIPEGTPCAGSRAARCPSIRAATSSRRKSSRRACTPSKSPVLDEDGNGALYLRDLEFKQNDWFYVGMADFTFSKSKPRPDAKLLQGENAPYDSDSSLDGRLAFYVNGKFSDDWRLTASADTREGPVNDLFSNFLDKSPDSLFRRIDPDYHYPTFGDDGIVEEARADARQVLREGEHGRQLTRCGATSRSTTRTTSWRRSIAGCTAPMRTSSPTPPPHSASSASRVDGFAAEPGTVAEPRGVPRHRRLALLPAQPGHPDRLGARADRDARQGFGARHWRRQPEARRSTTTSTICRAAFCCPSRCSSTATTTCWCAAAALSGDEAYLVVRYEYTPGFNELNDAHTAAAQGHYWLNDYVKLGLTGEQQR